LRGEYDYKWETTAAYSGKSKDGKKTGTTFVKVTDDFKKLQGTKDSNMKKLLLFYFY